MQAKKSKRLFHITLEFAEGKNRVVQIRAVTRDVAERKALKFNPNATGVVQDA